MSYMGTLLARRPGMMRRSASITALLLLGGLGVACAATSSEDDAGDEVGASDGAIITASEKALVGSYRGDPNGIVRGLYTKDPTKNYAFEKKVVFTLDVDASKVPGLCPTPQSPGEICGHDRIEGQIIATSKTLELRANDPNEIAPQVKDLLGKYKYTLGASSLVLTKVGNAAQVITLTKGSYCSEEFDCNMQRPDDTCQITYECTTQHACAVKQDDPTCDRSWRSVTDLGDLGGTWTSTNAPAGKFTKIELTPKTGATRNDSDGTFVGTSSAGTKTGTFHAMPENPAIGFANLSFTSGPGMPELLVVSGVHLSAQNKVTEMRVLALGQTGPVGQPWVYTRQAP